jgi:hypothetical protein
MMQKQTLKKETHVHCLRTQVYKKQISSNINIRGFVSVLINKNATFFNRNYVLFLNKGSKISLMKVGSVNMKIEAKQSLREQLKDHCDEFLGRSTINGLINIRNNPLLLKLIWLILFLGSTAFCFFLIVSTVSSYLQFEVITKIKIKQKIPIDFPIVKICDVNSFSTEYAKRVINEHFNASGIQNPFDATNSNKKYMRSAINFLRDLLKHKIIRLSQSEKKKLGMDFSELLVSCNFGNEECTAANFTWKYDNTDGNCYIFNSGVSSNGSKISTLSSTQSGISNGFRLEVLLPQPELYYMDMVYGLRLYVGDSTMEDSEYEYVGLCAGLLSNIGIKKTVSKALSTPYSDCNLDASYSQDNCIQTCYNTAVLKNCNCSQLTCFSLEQVTCEHNYHDKFYRELFSFDACSMSCVPSCKRTVYDLSTSDYVYPSDNYANNLLAYKASAFKNQNISSINIDYLRKNLIALTLYWKNLEYTLIEESATTTELELISNVGGLLGKNNIKI